MSSLLPRPAIVLTAAALLVAGCSDPVSHDHDVASVDVTPKSARIWIVGDSARFSAQVTTKAGTDGAGIPVVWTSRNPALLTVSSDGVAKSVARGGTTYVVATAGAVSDSALVEVPLTPCGSTTPVTLQVGDVATDIGAAGFCTADIPDAQYTVVAFNTSLVSSVSTTIEVVGQGLGTPPAGAGLALGSRAGFSRPTGLLVASPLRRDTRSEASFRQDERAMLSPKAAGARAWFDRRSAGALRATVPPAVGDIDSVNVSMSTSCAVTSRINHAARVAAVSNAAIILDDQTNPPGGFTDDEYASFAAAFDSVVNPLDTTTFGAPTDLDHNGHVVIIFTRTINEMTPAGSQTYIGGRTMSRDLLPTASCPASNVGELFYMLVPDPNGAVNGNTDFTKDFVQHQTLVTIAHEYQHMINISRRTYLLGSSAQPLEEVWMQEGLSHSAEALLFHRITGLPTRANLGLGDLTTTAEIAQDFNDYMSGDFFLYDSYVGASAITSPFHQSDDVSTRGATWSFLRFAADQRASTDGRLFYNLVNSGLVGLTNLETQLGKDATGFQALVRDFTVSVFADDFIGVPARFTQPSWNMRSIYPGFNDPNLTFPLVTRSLSDNAPQAAGLAAGGFSVFQFQNLPGTAALIRATGTGGSTLPAGITLSVIRTK